MNFSYFSFSIFSFICGVAFCSILNLGFVFGLFLILLSIILFLINRSAWSTPIYLCLVFFLLFFGLGFLRCYVSDQILDENVLKDYIGEEVSLKGIIIDEPDQRENNTKLTLKVSSFGGSTPKLDVDVRILLTVPHYPQYVYGD